MSSPVLTRGSVLAASRLSSGSTGAPACGPGVEPAAFLETDR